MSNHLLGQSSPYLLQHAENPVAWYPWGEEAFEKAEQENKPVFLSIGYSTCHWCHVMAEESFENTEIAEILNRYFIAIKVDREERPDIDSVYMTVCQTLTGHGGWPLSIFMTAKQKPFFAGTYFPPTAQQGIIGFRELLLAIAKQWKTNPITLSESADAVVSMLQKQDKAANGQIDNTLPETAVKQFFESFDSEYGGFGTAPKFPAPHHLIFLMLYSQINAKNHAADQHTLKPVLFTLEQMRRGGIFDQIGYGFSRYSTDRYYLVPHFEKMLYDNAMLILAYAIAYKISGSAFLLDTAEQTAKYILQEMRGKNGAFFSAQDADSEGKEGKFYLWDYEEICQVLGKERGKTFCDYYGITREGNFEGKNIANLLNGNPFTEQFEDERKQLYEYRKSRAKLHLDDKVLTSWNSLMICAMSYLYRITQNELYRSAAEDAQQFIENNLAVGNTLYVSYRNGVRSVQGFLDDFSYYTAALLCLYEATGNSYYLKRSDEICAEAHHQFADETNGGYFLYSNKSSHLVFRPKETYDGALPSGNSVMAYCLVRLSQLTDAYAEEPSAGNTAIGENHAVTQSIHYAKYAEKQLSFLSQEAAYYPAGYSLFLIAQLFFTHPPQTITVVLAKPDSAEAILKKLPLYADITLLEHETEAYRLLHNKTTYYVCKNHTCLPPTNHMPQATPLSS